MKRILIINTGGTIAMSEDPLTHTVKTQGNIPLVDLIPHLSQYAEIEMINYLNIPSPHITIPIMVDLYHKIKQLKDEKAYDGFVVTHGTDTLEETAFFLDLVWPYDEPIVVTGAMRSSNELGADGPINLVHSVRVASSDKTRGKGVMVVFNDEIHSALHVTKTHTSNPATFQSPGLGPVGLVTKKEIVYLYGLPQRKVVPIQKITGKVPLIKMVAGIESELLSCLRMQQMSGIVIEAFGAGNVPPQVSDEIKKWREKDLPVVIVSRCFQGVVQDIYGYEGGGGQLKEMGVIFCNGLNGQKARIKLLVALEQDWPAEQFTQYFEI